MSGSSEAPDVCPRGSYCPANSTDPTPCAVGTFNNETGAGECTGCPAGYFCKTKITSFYVTGRKGTNKCPSDSVRIATLADCTAAAQSRGLKSTSAETKSGYPKGCYISGGDPAHFNNNAGSADSYSSPLCKAGNAPTLEHMSVAQAPA